MANPLSPASWPDPIVVRYLRDVDRTLLRRNLALSPEERLNQLQELARFAEELRRAGKKARGAELVVHREPDILGGTPVFIGTRVPVRILFEYLEAGHSLEVLLEQFPTVRREQAVAALEMAREILTEDANPA